MNNKLYTLLIITCLLGFPLQGATTEDTPENIFASLRDNYLGLFDSRDSHVNESMISRTLNTHTKLSILYRLFENSTDEVSHTRTTSALNTQSWYDLQLIRGNHNPLKSVFNAIDRTQTTAGMVTLQSMLTQPLTTFPAIKKQQEIIKRLVEDDELYKNIREQLKTAKKHENAMLTFWDTDQGAQMYLKEIVDPELNEASKKILDMENKEKAMRISMRTARASDIFSRHVTPFSPEIAQTDWKKIEFWRWCNIPTIARIAAASGLSITLLLVMYEVYQNHRAHPGMIQRLIGQQLARARAAWGNRGNMSIPKGIAALIVLFFVFDHYYNKIQDFYSTFLESPDYAPYMALLEKMQSVAAFFAVTKKLEKTSSVFIHTAPLTNLLLTNEKARELDTLLQSPTIAKKSWFKYYLARMGKVAAAYDLTRVLRPQLAPLFNSIGTIDAYMSIATLVREHRDSPNKFCFPTLIDPKKTDHPTLALTGVWHPLLDAQTAIPSNFALGGDRTERNGILTGPNAGGKSTNLAAITIALVMAQAFGIAAAEEMTFTPFTIINTYMNITEDMAQGRSTFKMEVYRANQLMKTIEANKEHDYVFSIMDELFSGTNPREAQAAAYSIARYLATHKNSMLMLATHYPIMKRLEGDTGGVFKNFKIKAEIQPISYPFNLHEGASDQQIALEILREEGFDGGELLKYADDIMAHPERYGIGVGDTVN